MSYGYQTWLLDALADEFRNSKGFRVDYVPGWQKRGSRHFSPIGVIDHHTGPAPYNSLLKYMAYNSRIAPLCNTATSRPNNGVVRITVVSAGRANHAGRGYLSWTGRDNGNYRSLGRENQNTGSQSWPDQQLEAIRRCDAVELKYLGANVGRLADHKTYTSRKVDRYALDINNERRLVKQIMEGPSDPWEEFWMGLNNDQKKVLEDFSSQLIRDKVNGGSFAFQLTKFLRTQGGLVTDFLEGISYMNSSPGGLAKATAALWREAGAREWERDLDKFRENRLYTPDELE